MRIVNPVPHSNDIQPLVDAVLVGRPDLSGENVSAPSVQGNDGWTVFIGNEVFKAPRREDLAGDFEREVRVHSHLQGKTRTPIPEITHVQIDGDNCLFGMKKLSGVPASLELIESLSPQQQTQLAKDVANFMIDVGRAFTSEDIKALGIKTIDTPTTMTGPITLASVSESLDNHAVQALLGDELLRRAREFERRYAELPPLSKGYTVAHGDPTAANLLFDKSTGRLSCVLDFGRVSVHPIECDLMLLSMPPNCLEQTIRQYVAGGGREVKVDTVFANRHAFMISALKNMVGEERVKPMRDRIVGLLDRELPEVSDTSPSRAPGRPGARKTAEAARARR